jgi:beta-lactamase class A
MRALLAACLALALVGAGCGAPLRPEPTLAPTSVPPTAAPRSIPNPVLQSLSRAVARTPMATATPPRAAATPTPTPKPVLDGLLDGILPDTEAEFSIVLEDLASGARATINADQTLPSASLYKLGLAWATLRQVDAGRLSLDDSLEIEDEDAIEPEPDSGISVGDTPSVREAVTAMVSVSSNASAHALLRLIGRETFTAEMDSIGLHQTRVPDDSPAVTSATDIARLLRLIATSSELSRASHAVIAQAMANIAPPDALRDALPSDVGIFDKTGNLDDASNVGALLETQRATAILVVIDTSTDPGVARAVITQAGQIAYHALLR